MSREEAVQALLAAGCRIGGWQESAPIPVDLIRERSCGTKRRWSSQAKAKRAAHHTHSSDRLCAYPCTFCGYWHVGGGKR